MVWWVLGRGFSRFLRGRGGGGGFPGSAKAVAEWFPPKERSLAFGIFNTGSSVGAVLAPLLIPPIVAGWGWRSVFYVTGGVGFLWAAVWCWLYRPPTTNRFISAEEREY